MPLDNDTSNTRRGSQNRHIVRPPGLHRTSGPFGGWVDDRGRPVVNQGTLERLERLSLPPAWTHVWAAANPGNSIQATGVDARGRTQYRYSLAALATGNQRKFDHLLQFAGALPKLRHRISGDLEPETDVSTARPSACQVTAAVMRLLDKGLFRVGNGRYARDNHTYGLTTLRRGQVTVQGNAAVFDFVGKEHIAHHLVISDEAVAKILQQLLSIPGTSDEALFTATNPPWHIDSATINSYIHAHGAVEGSAKVFRTWGATVAAAAVAAGATFPRTPRRSQDLVPFDAAAHLLGNTPGVARQSYVHPKAVIIGQSPEVRAAVGLAAEDSGSDDVRRVFHDTRVQAAVYNRLSADS